LVKITDIKIKDMEMKQFTKILALATFSLAIASCSSTREQFDFSKKAPDEFMVTTRAPLEMPPDYNLRPPRPGAQRPQEETAVDEAKQAVFGVGDAIAETRTPQDAPMSEGEAILLRKTNAVSVDPNIRDKVDAETQVMVKENTSTVNKLLGKVGKKVDAPATVVDPVKESERIIQNQESGKPITAGATPTLEE
jgi:hypothetical protein